MDRIVKYIFLNTGVYIVLCLGLGDYQERKQEISIEDKICDKVKVEMLKGLWVWRNSWEVGGYVLDILFVIYFNFQIFDKDRRII